MPNFRRIKILLLPQLNLPQYTFKYKTEGKRTQIFDAIRKKYVALTDEEWVRQNFIRYLIEEKKFPASLMSVESSLKYNSLQKRSDLVVYDTSGKPHLILECKAPLVKITQDAFDQAARYNMTYKVKYLIITNGINHFCCEMDYLNNSYCFLKNVPDFQL